ncbi:hypothetical protein AK812_SmicGene34186 [Symbiodinium microadriaticum]|uniref:Uncharacterized protein n=1 Tax=Symbiodinium microadriaticum TaxID=2951 RepID=A0A1Q9CPS4_SYMMI|nr:hypothetical protein AK812_SmicGene34186 [Symbiodinium microadriaticum]
MSDRVAKWRQSFQKARSNSAQVQADLQKLELLSAQDVNQRSERAKLSAGIRGKMSQLKIELERLQRELQSLADNSSENEVTRKSITQFKDELAQATSTMLMTCPYGTALRRLLVCMMPGASILHQAATHDLPREATVAMGKAMANIMKAKRVTPEISAATGLPKRIRRDRGAKAAKKAAKMTKETWRKYQSAEHREAWPKPDYMQETIEAKAVRDGGQGAYRDRTYEIVTRWTQHTKIAYRPHAKAPGSKSHIRYEKYSKAKTVGQALKLGSYPIDWCFDYEHGFIKVVGGDIRDEPIDKSMELAKRCGLRVADLRIERGAMESMHMRAHRLVAERTAQEILKRKKNGRITADDVETVLTNWSFGRNTSRQNVMPQGQEWVKSDTLGLLRDRGGNIHALNKFLLQRLPEEAAAFKWTSLNLNCNYAARRHRDANNFGPSFIQAFGKFTGGTLSVWPEDNKQEGKPHQLPEKMKQTVDIKKNLVLFNGNTAHEVNDFEGTRFSVVYFCCGCHDKTPKPVQEELKKFSILNCAACRKGRQSWMKGSAAVTV